MVMSKALRICIAVAVLALAVVIVRIWGTNGVDEGTDKDSNPIKKVYPTVSITPNTVNEQYMDGYYVSEEELQTTLSKQSVGPDNEGPGPAHPGMFDSGDDYSDDAVKSSVFWNSNAHWLAMALQEESGINWPDWAVMMIGDVILNRVNSPRFPNTIKEVLLAPGQYSPFLGDFEMFMPETRYIMLAERLLEGEHSLKDREIVYQSLFEQGSVTVVSYYDEVLDTTTYFCK